MGFEKNLGNSAPKPESSTNLATFLEGFKNPYIRFLQMIGIFPEEISESFGLRADRPRLNYTTLSQTFDEEGQTGIQNIKHEYIKDVIRYRTQHGIGVPMKIRAQLLVQEMLEDGLDTSFLGDPSTFVLDPLDTESCIAAARFLLEKQGRTDLWIGFGMTTDWTDPMATHPSSRPPVLGKDNPIKSIEDFKNLLVQAKQIVENERLTKLARKLARAANRKYDALDTASRNRLLEKQKPLAQILLQDVKDTGDWESLNEKLHALNLTPLEFDDHCLIKVFSQDNLRWQIGDLIVDQHGSLSIDFPRSRLTPREDEGNARRPLSLTIHKRQDSKPMISGDLDHLHLLMPILNSADFFNLFDSKVLPKLGPSPYHQVQFMVELTEPINQANTENHADVFNDSKIAFISDIISGTSPNNMRDKNGHGNTITQYIADINPTKIRETAILVPAHLEDYITHFPTHLTALLNKLKAGLLTNQDQEIASNLLFIYDGWQGYLHLPPSTKKILENIVQTGKSQVSPNLILSILDLQRDTDGVIR